VDELDQSTLSEILARVGYKGVLAEVARQAEAVGNIPGQELASNLDSLVGNFGYFPVLE